MQTTKSDRRRRRYLRWRSLLSRLAPPLMSKQPEMPTVNESAWRQLRRAGQAADGTTLHLMRRDGCRITVPLCELYTLIGQSAACSVRLDDPKIAAVQAAFVWNAGRLFLIDAARSSFGPLDAAAENVWRWGNWTASVTGLPAMRSAIAYGPMARLDWPDAGIRPTQISRPVTVVGSAAVCSVRLSQAGIAPIHAALLRADAAVWLINLTDRAAMQVNGRAVDFSLLDPGDELAFGPVTATLSAAWTDTLVVSPHATASVAETFAASPARARTHSASPE